jgi:Uma2 family endonuclease
MSLPAERQRVKYSYKDYLEWDDDGRWEIIEGLVFDMTPAPSVKHQGVLMELSRQFANYLINKKCRVFTAPLDVILPESSENSEDIHNVVQPDLIVVCDPEKLDEKGCRGAPDLVVEILSPSTAQKDMKLKLSLYESHGVREYWIIHPYDKTLMVLSLGRNRRYGRPQIYSDKDRVMPGLFHGDLAIDLEAVFRE